MTQKKTVVAIETSCDETAVALFSIENGQISLLDETLSSQIKVHAEYGGVVPEVASREHLKSLPILFQLLLERNNVSKSEIDAVAVTTGPGLKGCLLIGLEFAKGFALANRATLLPTNHIEGHLLVPMLDNPTLTFPYLALVVSGGHTELIEARSVGDYSILAKTSDDAAGEAFDKSAKLLGFEYPGGPLLSQLADTVCVKEAREAYPLPVVMRQAQGFSFSGLKTAVSVTIKKNTDKVLHGDGSEKALLAAAVQDAIVESLIWKTKRASKESDIKNVVVTGGVAANKRLRARLEEEFNDVFYPIFEHCTDNAAMIGFAACHRLLAQKNITDLQVKARWPVDQISNVD